MARAVVTQTAGTSGDLTRAAVGFALTNVLTGQVLDMGIFPVDSTGGSTLKITPGQVPVGAYTARAGLAPNDYFDTSDAPPVAVVVVGVVGGVVSPWGAGPGGFGAFGPADAAEAPETRLTTTITPASRRGQVGRDVTVIFPLCSPSGSRSAQREIRLRGEERLGRRPTPPATPRRRGARGGARAGGRPRPGRPG